MRVLWRDLFTSKVEAGVRWDRWDSKALVVGVFIVIWVFAIKLRTFYNLGYSSDLFVSVQLARSWLEGRGLLNDNCFGKTLATHTYFLLVPLGLIAKPFGAPGLLLALAVSVGVVYFWGVRILRLLGIAGPVAVIAAGALLASPISVAFYQERFFGFHVELLTPALCLVLFYFLLQRRMIPSIAMALAVISVKEDAPIAAAMVAIVAGVETWISSTDKHSRLNYPALIVLLLSVFAVPLLLAISSLQPHTEYARHSPDPRSVFVALAANVTQWPGSAVVRLWLWVMVVGSFGMILLRPYYLIPGVLTTLVAWLRNDLLWAPRFYPTETLLWCVTLVGFASVVHTMRCGGRTARATALTVTTGVATISLFAQVALVPKTRYLVRSGSGYSRLERRQADSLFERYRREGTAEEPVVASPMLFRYAHDRNLFWLNRMYGRPTPIWVLSDGTTNYGYDDIHVEKDMLVDRNRRCMLRLEDYTMIDRRGRFMLFRKKD
ncbi:MAG TPA: hypothetical protein VJ420_02475 [Candidatus Udaeobacter sp.]|nr:hypothetical protein [Candidatus Udaeobacter sp.]